MTGGGREKRDSLKVKAVCGGGSAKGKAATQENTHPSCWKILRQRNRQTMELIPPPPGNNSGH